MDDVKLPAINFLDDDKELLSLFSDMAGMLGLESVVYDAPEKFINNAAGIEKNSLLVLDLSMPDIDGVQVMRHLVDMHNVPVLILISGHDEGVLHSAEQLGKAQGLDIVASLNKPIDLNAFELAIKKYLKRLQFKESYRKTLQKSNNAVEPQELLTAIQQRQLVLHYQPKVSMQSDQLIGVEALVRWQHPERGLIYPDSFISIAEAHGWIGELTHEVIRMAVEQSREWQSKGFDIPVSVNISADNITSLSLPEQLTELLEAKQLQPSSLMLEITESVLMGELVTSLDILTRMRIKGIGLSIDDFGTGYSSLSQLHRIPFTELKIDGSFVMSMLEDSESKAIVKTCIMLGHELKMKVVAEGVEEQAHWDLLRELGCDVAQGYFISRPVDAKTIDENYNNRH